MREDTNFKGSDLSCPSIYFLCYDINCKATNYGIFSFPGWEKQSYGYHGDDGQSFSSSGTGKPYGPTFTTGDVIGCGVNMIDNTVFYTKNGIKLGEFRKYFNHYILHHMYNCDHHRHHCHHPPLSPSSPLITTHHYHHRHHCHYSPLSPSSPLSPPTTITIVTTDHHPPLSPSSPLITTHHYHHRHHCHHPPLSPSSPLITTPTITIVTTVTTHHYHHRHHCHHVPLSPSSPLSPLTTITIVTTVTSHHQHYHHRHHCHHHHYHHHQSTKYCSSYA